MSGEKKLYSMTKSQLFEERARWGKLYGVRRQLAKRIGTGTVDVLNDDNSTKIGRVRALVEASATRRAVRESQIEREIVAISQATGCVSYLTEVKSALAKSLAEHYRNPSEATQKDIDTKRQEIDNLIQSYNADPVLKRRIDQETQRIAAKKAENKQLGRKENT